MQRQNLLPMPAALDIAGTPVHALTQQQFLQHLAAWIEQATPATHCRQVATVNPEFVVDAQRDHRFATVLQTADLCVADGVGILLAARLLGYRLPARITGSDSIYTICAAAASHGWRVFLLGAAPGVADLAGRRLTAMYPALTIVGTLSGHPDAAGWPEINAALEATEPDFLFVAFGHPRQDLWIADHRADLTCTIAMGVGGAFDYVAGITTRAPQAMRKLGLEWLHRLGTQPWRWRRMLKLPRFVWLVWRQRFGQGSL